MGLFGRAGNLLKGILRGSSAGASARDFEQVDRELKEAREKELAARAVEQDRTVPGRIAPSGTEPLEPKSRSGKPKKKSMGPDD